MKNWKLTTLAPCALALCALAMPSAAIADAAALPERASTVDDAEDALQEILDEYTEAYAEFRKAYGDADTDEARRAVVEELLPDPEPFAARVLVLAKDHPGTDVAWQGLTWVLGRAGRTETAKKAMVVITSEYIEDERLGDICLRASRAPSNETLLAALRHVVEKSPHREVCGKAAYALGMQYKQLAEQEPQVQTTSLKPVTKADPQQWLQNFTRQMQVVIEEYGDVEYFRGDLATKASAELFELNRLQIGMLAPDIEGEDLDGVSFKLSEYRGKVVVLDFWGNW